MTTLSQDPKGYYAALGLAPGADLAAIKAAYRARVKSVHPDRNRAATAREEFQRLVEAYRVLKDVVHRAEYDNTGGHPLVEDGDDYPVTPFACTCCGKVTAQPRYVVFHRVKSYLLWARRSRVEGIFCRDCADQKAAQASTLTWAWGWWSPLGPFLTVSALVRNLLGGTKPGHQNARLLIRQARAFLNLDDFDIARALADQAAAYARTSVHRRQVEDLRKQIPPSPRKLRDRWGFWRGGVFAAQALPLVALPLVGGIYALIAAKPWDKPVATSAGIVVARAGVGEMRHVAIDDLKLRQAPLEGAPVLALLDRFTTVQVVDAPEGSDFTKVKSPAGVEGWVSTRALYAGSGMRFKQEWCADNKGAVPAAGEVLSRRATGEHRLLIHNDGRQDAVVKLKTVGGNTVVSYYIPATYHIGVAGIPEGTYRIEFATGTAYSRGCGIFVEDMQAGLMPFTLTLKQVSALTSRGLAAIPEITLVAPPGDPKQPQPLDNTRFAADE